MIRRSSGLFHLAASEAAGADFDTHHSTVDLRANLEKIRLEFAAGLVVCMADIIAELTLLPANCTFA